MTSWNSNKTQTPNDSTFHSEVKLARWQFSWLQSTPCLWIPSAAHHGAWSQLWWCSQWVTTMLPESSLMQCNNSWIFYDNHWKVLQTRNASSIYLLGTPWVPKLKLKVESKSADIETRFLKTNLKWDLHNTISSQLQLQWPQPFNTPVHMNTVLWAHGLH